MSRTSSQNGAISGAFARIAPFFLPALLFQTGAFAFISPVPLLILTLRASVPVSLAALVCNALILIAFRNQPGILIGPFLWFGIGVFFPLLIRKTGKIQQSFALSYAAMITLLVVALSVSAHHAQLGIVDYVRAEIGRGIDQLLVNPDKATKVILEEEGREGLYKKVLTELPSGLLIALLLSFWANLLFASQWVRGFLSKTFWSRFKTPEWLVWPTLFCGGLYAAGLYKLVGNAPYFIGLNGFKLLLVSYGLQGLSILTFFLNRIGASSLIKTVLLTLGLILALPFVVGVGFFDLWFDFRRKFGQS